MDNFRNIEVNLPRDQFSQIGVEIVELLVQSGFVKSKTEGRKQIQNKAVKLNDTFLVEDPFARLAHDPQTNTFFVMMNRGS